MPVRFLTAAALAVLLAACEGNDIPPPNPDPEVEGTVQPGESPDNPQGLEDETGQAQTDTVTPTQTDQPATNDPEMDQRLQEANQAAEERAQEIFEQVTSDADATETDTESEVAPIAPQTTPGTSSGPQGTTAPQAPDAPDNVQQQTTPQQNMAPQNMSSDGVQGTRPPQFRGGTLAAPASLQGDTVAAARTFMANGGGYQGVWAARAADCELIDQGRFNDFAVIGPEQARLEGSQCTIEDSTSTAQATRLEGQCTIGDTPVPTTITVAQTDTGAQISAPAIDVDSRYVPCVLPQ